MVLYVRVCPTIILLSNVITNGPQSVSATGAMLPTTPWEAMWQAHAQWLGIDDDQLAEMMPNLGAFKNEQLLTKDDVFSK